MKQAEKQQTEMRLFMGLRPGASTVLIALMVLAGIGLLVRASGLYFGVMGDEYTYTTMARLLPLSEAYIPNYLYLLIYKMTSVCGDGFGSCAKLFNVLFFVAAAPFIHAVARRFCPPRATLVIVAISLLGPVNSYTAYYMPEAMFFLSFWVCTWYFLNLDHKAGTGSWVIFGVLMGASSLIKPHALFALAAFCVCILFFACKAGGAWLKTGLKNCLIVVGTTLVVKFMVSFALAGKAGLTLFGSFYNASLSHDSAGMQRYIDILASASVSAAGHLLANALMFGTALAVMLYGALKALQHKHPEPHERIAFFALMLLFNLIAVVGLFTASVAGSNAIESAFRLHMRYYDFMLPLLFIAAGAQLSRADSQGFNVGKALVAVGVLLALVYAAVTRMQPFILSYIDGPEMRGYALNTQWFTVLSVLSGLSVLLWLKSARLGSLAFVFAYLPLSVAVSTAYNNAEVRQRMSIDAYDKAGLFAKDYIAPAERTRLVVIGDNIAATMRSLVYIGTGRDARDLSYVSGSVYSASQTPAHIKWVLAIGEVKFAQDEFEILKLNGFSLAKKKSSVYPMSVNFTASAGWSDALVHVTGLSQVEKWGTWSIEPVVEIKFAKPLPETFDLQLTANAFGPNVGKTFGIVVAGRQYPVVLAATPAIQTVRIDNPGKTDTLSIKIPAPTSPQSLGLGGDDRTLGIGLSELEIRLPE